MIGSLDSALYGANSGLQNSAAALALISQNVSNASTPGYVREVLDTTSLIAGGQGEGVLLGPAQRVSDDALQSVLLGQTATAAASSATVSGLQLVDSAQGQPGDSTNLAAQLGQLQDAFTSLLTDPSNQASQAQVVTAATNLTNQINSVAGAIGQARQTAQNTIVSDVQSIDTALAGIGGLSDQIVRLQAQGQSTAALESQRDAAVQGLAKLVGVRTFPQPDGDLVVTTTGGLLLDTHASSGPLATAAATIGPQSAAGAGVPPITLGGEDVTSQLTGGDIGANIALRDTTLPGLAAGLDEFSETLSTRFSSQGLALFTDPTGAVPTPNGPPVQSGYIGFSSTITVNPAVVANPALVRDGTQAVAGSATGATAFTPNPAGGPVGFNTLITRVLSFALGADAQDGVAQPAPNTTGLGPTGSLSAGYLQPGSLATLASATIANEAGISSAASSTDSINQSALTQLTSAYGSATGVDVDQELSNMIQVQNAYAANAKIIAAVQTLWGQLLQALS